MHTVAFSSCPLIAKVTSHLSRSPRDSLLCQWVFLTEKTPFYPVFSRFIMEGTLHVFHSNRWSSTKSYFVSRKDWPLARIKEEHINGKLKSKAGILISFFLRGKMLSAYIRLSKKLNFISIVCIAKLLFTWKLKKAQEKSQS